MWLSHLIHKLYDVLLINDSDDSIMWLSHLIHKLYDILLINDSDECKCDTVELISLFLFKLNVLLQICDTIVWW